jgi:glycosyltransferase involved in cell wall biosynthesis
MKRILYFHQHFSTRSGATGTRSYEFGKFLTSKGYNVTVVCGSNFLARLGHEERTTLERYEVDGISVIQIPTPYSNLDGLPLRAWKFIKFAILCIKLVFTEKYDLVFATSTPLTISIPGIVAKIFLRKKFIFEVRDLWPELPKAMGVVKNPVILKMLDILETWSYSCSDHVIGLSPGIVDGILKKSPSKPVSMIPNGSDTELFFPIESTKNDLCIEGIKNSDFVAIFTGAHGIANGLHNVLEAANFLREENDIKFLFIGDGKLKKSLIDRSVEMGLDNVVFLDPIAKTDLNKFLNRADIGLMVLDNVPAFYYGTSPNKFFDYISSGLPVLINYPGWLSEEILKNNCGISVKPDSAESFAQGVLKMRSDSLSHYSSNARKLALEEFSRKKLCEQFVEVIRQYV